MDYSFNNSKMGPVRALLAIIIVLGHFSYFMWAPTLKYMRMLAPPSVAMFLFISGYGLTKSVMLKGDNYLDKFLVIKTVRILFPALLVSLLHLLLCSGGGIMPWERIEAIFLHGDTLLPHYWFVWYIIGAYVVFWLCHQFLPLKYVKYVSMATSLAFVAYARLASFDWCWWICAFAIPAGVGYAEYEDKVYDYWRKGKCRFCAVILVLSAIMVLCYFAPFVLLRTVSYALFTVCAAFVISCLPIDKWRLPGLRFIGSISYEIFLVHITVMQFLRGRKVDINENVPYLIVATVAIVLTAWALHHVSTRLSRMIK